MMRRMKKKASPWNCRGKGGEALGKGLLPSVCVRGAKWSTERPYCSTPFPPLYHSLVFTAHSSP